MIEGFDFRNPDYPPISAARVVSLGRIRATPADYEDLRLYYRDSPEGIADFIEDWGWTYDPRNVERRLPADMPFVLAPKQREFVNWVVGHWKARTPGLAEKSRDGGLSWLCVAVGCALCIFHDGMRIGYGSRKAEYVDKVDDPKSLFWKARYFMKRLPEEFRGGWREQFDSPFMRMNFPATGSSMGGEGGEDIGRGDRTSVYFVDEAAHLAQPTKVDMALSQTTNCRIDVSSVNGPNNPFAIKRHNGKVDVFVWDWRDDPRKDQAWYDKQVAELDPIVVAQEIDRDYSASVEGVLIPRKWLDACIDAREKLGIAPVGAKGLAFDVADGGADKNAVAINQGVSIDLTLEWAGGAGEAGDIFKSVERVFSICDEHGIDSFDYDADGIGASVRGDSRVINERRARTRQRQLAVRAYIGSGELLDPEGEDIKGRKNEDFFKNRKAQSWWRVRERCRKTFRWVVDKVPCDPTEIVSFNSKNPSLHKLIAEMGQPQYRSNDIGQTVIMKKPDGMKSPNQADAVVIRLAGGGKPPMVVTRSHIAVAMRPGPRTRPRY